MVGHLCASIALVAAVAVSDQVRVWTDSTGSYTTEAEFVDLENGNVRLKKADGNVITLPMEKLSPPDQQFVRSLLASGGDEEKVDRQGQQAVSDPADTPADSEVEVMRSEELPDTAAVGAAEPSVTAEPPAGAAGEADAPADDDDRPPPPVWHGIVGVLTGFGPLSLLVQYGLLCLAAFGHIYQILYMRRDSVEVLDHQRLVVSTLAILGVNLVFYQIAIALAPTSGRGRLVLYMLAVFVVMIFLRVVVQMVGGSIDRDRTLKDSRLSQEQRFNCNWPLIPRCCNQSLSYLVLIGALAKFGINQ